MISSGPPRGLGWGIAQWEIPQSNDPKCFPRAKKSLRVERPEAHRLKWGQN